MTGRSLRHAAGGAGRPCRPAGRAARRGPGAGRPRRAGRSRPGSGPPPWRRRWTAARRRRQRGQVLGVGPEAVQAAPDGLAQRPRRDAAREPVDGHDATHVEQRPAVVALEVGVVQLGAPALQLDLAARDHGVAGLELPLDEAPPEPDGLDLAAVVLERRRRQPEPPPVGALDADGADRGPHRDHRPRRRVVQPTDGQRRRADRGSGAGRSRAGRGPCGCPAGVRAVAASWHPAGRRARWACPALPPAQRRHRATGAAGLPAAVREAAPATPYSTATRRWSWRCPPGTISTSTSQPCSRMRRRSSSTSSADRPVP